MGVLAQSWFCWTPLSLGWFWGRVNTLLCIFTTLWLSLCHLSRAVPTPSTIPRSQHHSRGARGGRSRGRTCLASPAVAQPLPRSSESAEPVVDGP